MTQAPRLTERQRFWLEHLRACGSGSLKAYAQTHGLDLRALYDAKAQRSAEHGEDSPDFRVERDAVVRRIKDEGRYPWRTVSGATRQSLAENAVSRFKALVGVKLAARGFGNQQVEALVKSQVLNRMTALGMPRSERISVG